MPSFGDCSMKSMGKMSKRGKQNRIKKYTINFD